jgi:hypothetical protein
MQSILVEMNRLHISQEFEEVKDPVVVQMPDKSFFMMASVGTSTIQKWRIGRFTAQNPQGPWTELPFVELTGIEGPEVCAPALQLEQRADGGVRFNMYVQTACFREDGIIAVATSDDGHNFKGQDSWSLTRNDVPVSEIPVVGLYDVGLSEIEYEDRLYDCMMFSAYRRIGCGDVFMTLRERNGTDAEWSAPVPVLKQEDVPFHNRPDSPNFEWGLEGAKLVQLADNHFVMIGVCFLEKGLHEVGTRQRVFLAAAETPFGPFHPVTTPLQPTKYDIGEGENGHPDTIDLGDSIGILYQERAGNRKPWHLRYAEIAKAEMMALAPAPRSWAPVPDYRPAQQAFQL